MCHIIPKTILARGLISKSRRLTLSQRAGGISLPRNAIASYSDSRIAKRENYVALDKTRGLDSEVCDIHIKLDMRET